MEPPPKPGLDLADRMADAITRISFARSLDDIAEIVPRAARRLTGADGATFVLKEQQQTSYAGEEVIGPDWAGQHFPEGREPGWWTRQNQPLKIADVDEDDRIPHEAYSQTMIRSLVMVPIGRDEAVGAITVCWAENARATDGQMRILQSLADATAVILDNLKLRGAMEQLLAEKTAALQTVNEEFEVFALTAAHDLKNPLSVVKTNCWTLTEMFGSELSEKPRECVNRIADAANRMRDQIDAMLAVYRQSKADLKPENVDLSALATAIVKELREANPSRQAKVHIKENLSSFGDVRMLRVVLENLIGNAWKFTGKCDAATIEFGRKDDEGSAFFVCDNGAGFDMANVGKLFRLFSRIHRDDDFSGSGVGLASVQRLIHKHGGRIWAEGEVGAGATFFFTLPEAPVTLRLDEIRELEVMPAIKPELNVSIPVS
ncbi:MAG: signal transduction histidine kinase [Verrucomicrobiales bacterium]|jgi:signal transduction histidine kinase